MVPPSPSNPDTVLFVKILGYSVLGDICDGPNACGLKVRNASLRLVVDAKLLNCIILFTPRIWPSAMKGCC